MSPTSSFSNSTKNVWTYGKLIGVLLATVKNNELLIKNHERRSTSSKPNLEATANVARLKREHWRGPKSRPRRGAQRGRGRGPP